MPELTIENDSRVIAFDTAIAAAHVKELLCDDAKHRTDEVAAYIARVTPLMEKLKPDDEMRVLVQTAVDRMTKDSGIEMMEYQKGNLIKYQQQLTVEKADYIAEKLEASVVTIGEGL